MLGNKPGFATFWAGSRLPAYEAACLTSYLRHGYAITVYSFGAIAGLPPGVLLRPASDIVEEHYVSAFLIKDVPSLSHFSDLFRYRMFQRTDEIWVDTDMYMVRPLPLDLPPTLLAREDQHALCGAIMRLDRTAPALATLVSRTEAAAGRNLEWGETGPRLLTSVFGPAVLAKSYGPKLYFPIHYDDFWKVFLPEFRDECEALCGDAVTVHLWNNIVTKMGVWKEVMPPEGSYLHALFVRDGMTDLFQATFPAAEMRHVIDNYRMRMSGGFADVSKLARLAIPSIKRRAIRQFDRVRDHLLSRIWRTVNRGATRRPRIMHPQS